MFHDFVARITVPLLTIKHSGHVLSRFPMTRVYSTLKWLLKTIAFRILFFLVSAVFGDTNRNISERIHYNSFGLFKERRLTFEIILDVTWFALQIYSRTTYSFREFVHQNLFKKDPDQWRCLPGNPKRCTLTTLLRLGSLQSSSNTSCSWLLSQITHGYSIQELKMDFILVPVMIRFIVTSKERCYEEMGVARHRNALAGNKWLKRHVLFLKLARHLFSSHYKPLDWAFEVNSLDVSSISLDTYISDILLFFSTNFIFNAISLIYSKNARKLCDGTWLLKKGQLVNLIINFQGLSAFEQAIRILYHE